MTVKDQWGKLKDNWLLILIPFVLIFVVMGGFSEISSLVDDFSSSSSYDSGSSSGYERPSMGYSTGANYESASYSPESSASPVPYSEVALKSSPSISSDVSAPPLQDQMVAKTASMETKVERGTFANEESTLKSIVKASDAILLWQNVNTYGEGRAQYQAGRYQIKIDATKYDAIISQLKAIGTVESFTENAEDVTKAHADLNIELAGEKERLVRYQQMYKEATLTEDKISISDRILNEENYIKYLEEALKNVGEQVTYSTIDVTITETKSGYAELTFHSLSEFGVGLVGSASTVLYVLVVLLPWALGLWLVIWIIRKIRGKKTGSSKK